MVCELEGGDLERAEKEHHKRKQRTDHQITKPAGAETEHKGQILKKPRCGSGSNQMVGSRVGSNADYTHVVPLVQHQHVPQYRHHNPGGVQRAKEVELCAEAHLVQRSQV